MNSILEQNLYYFENLQTVKKSLNDLCLSVSEIQLKEKNNREKSEWYSKLIKFEQDQQKQVNNSNSSSSSVYFTNQNVFASSSSSSTSSSNYESSSESETQNDYLSEHQSAMSLSQSSLSSAYSSSSFIASVTSEDINTSNDASSSSLSTNEYLENYLLNTKIIRNQLESEYEKKYAKYLALKENVSNLNLNLNTLHEKLDNVKVDNISLSENVKSLRKQVDFYQNLKELKQQEEKKEEENLSQILDLEWLKAEMSQIKKETNLDYDTFNKEIINEYEEYLEKDLLEQIDLDEIEYNKEADEFEAESDLILNDLSELNKELSESVTEYEQLSETNQKLNDRLIQLSTNICSYSDLSPEEQDKLILNYSVKSLERQIENMKTEIKEQKNELNETKNKLIKKEINNNLLEPSQLDSFDATQNSTSKPIINSNINTNNDLKVRPYNSQIEYTKSNLFAYLIINFDVTRNYLATNKQVDLNFNSLRIVHDSIDGHNLVIENSHKILDLDLSEWTLRREIQNCVDIDSQLREQSSLNNIDNKEIIEFKFPKGFRLKRRKKINLIAAGNSYETKMKPTMSCTSLNNSDKNNNNLKKKLKSKKSLMTSSHSLANLNGIIMTPTITQTKCACCACKLLTTRKGGDDVFEAKEINTWGSGLLVVTKFINSKNIVKLVNFKIIKHIWMNSEKN